MLEAPYTGSQVKVSPVRSSGMAPYVTRLIEYRPNRLIYYSTQ
jgi:hypothetical protein